MSFTPVTSSSSSGGVYPEAFPTRWDILSLQCALGLLWGLLLDGHAWNTSTGRHQVPKPPQLASFNLKEEWCDICAHPVPKGSVRRKLISASWIPDLVIPVTTHTTWLEVKVGEGKTGKLRAPHQVSPRLSGTSQTSVLICTSSLNPLPARWSSQGNTWCCFWHHVEAISCSFSLLHLWKKKDFFKVF